MEIFKLEKLNFTYPGESEKALSDIDIEIEQGEFVVLLGGSGSGKTTLLRLLKPSLSPVGELCGNISFRQKPLADYGLSEHSSQIGFVMQSADDQIVTDKVWHELAFGLESLGVPQSEMHARIAETASFFGLGELFHKKISELSGGQKQLLCLASVMVMRPSVLLLDEPTSALDPIAAQELLGALDKIRRELSTTIVVSEHRAEDILAYADRAIVLERGRKIADTSPRRLSRTLAACSSEMLAALPAPTLIHDELTSIYEPGKLDAMHEPSPLTVCEGKLWLEDFAGKHAHTELAKASKSDLTKSSDTALELDEVFFRYEKELPDVVRGLSLKLERGTLTALLGGNGAGKSTALALMGGIIVPYRGKVRANGTELAHYSGLYDELGIVFQDPECMFTENTVISELSSVIPITERKSVQAQARVRELLKLFELERFTSRHPYDLSGGERERLAIAKVLIKRPRLLLLDEPTKGMDAPFKKRFAEILASLKQDGVTIVMVSHDMEFCAEHADMCALFFDGNITSVAPPREFFSQNSYYTTSTSRMSREVVPNAVCPKDLLKSFGVVPHELTTPKAVLNMSSKDAHTQETPTRTEHTSKKARISIKRKICGAFFALALILTLTLQLTGADPFGIACLSDSSSLQFISLAEAALALLFLIPQKRLGYESTESKKHPCSRRTVLALAFTLLCVPLTIFIGMYYLGDRRYYLISMLIILETLIPFFAVFEGRRPQAREVVLIGALCAIAVASRAAFYMLPQFKPVTAIIILTGVCFGGETGFLVGATTGFVSNFFFGQGPWTPWQMLAFGLLGLFSGIVFNTLKVKKSRVALCAFGFAAVFIIYGGIMNPASVLLMQNKPTLEMLIASYVSGAPFDLIHAVSTAIFMYILAEPMIEKLERIKKKYGLI